MLQGVGSADPRAYLPARNSNTPVLIPMLFTYTSTSDPQGTIIMSMEEQCNTPTPTSGVVHVDLNLLGQVYLLGFVPLWRNFGMVTASMSCDNGMQSAILNSAELFNLTQR